MRSDSCRRGAHHWRVPEGLHAVVANALGELEVRLLLLGESAVGRAVGGADPRAGRIPCMGELPIRSVRDSVTVKNGTDPRSHRLAICA